jgi:hypothetical protein
MVESLVKSAQNYAERLKIPLMGGIHQFYSSSRTLIANGYLRVVIGGRGPYVEFSGDNIVFSSLYVPLEAEYRLNSKSVYYIELRSEDEANVKVYYQLKPVLYADYRVDYYYISPFDLWLEDGTPVITKLNKKEKSK